MNGQKRGIVSPKHSRIETIPQREGSEEQERAGIKNCNMTPPRRWLGGSLAGGESGNEL
jgi:hypothetical protein